MKAYFIRFDSTGNEYIITSSEHPTIENLGNRQVIRYFVPVTYICCKKVHDSVLATNSPCVRHGTLLNLNTESSFYCLNE